ncbi:ATP-binding response regulator [Piscinibacter koreensis]|uniref:histidine kinase n=1 Tax=Piscinibacter koreensis TaxID=2742824 RepID=A0A7Y6NM86_9BURK|nr:hybrid sensor histidine kinase/response regulator [Schlegelella koreensis]NUZ05755.1 hybrid sensor histidine kinase/response regulator [Schlegelella koreensis]
MKLASYFGAHEIDDRGEQEQERASQRALVSGGLLLFWGAKALQSESFGVSRWFVLVTLGYFVGTLWYWVRLRSKPSACVACQYLCLLLDPVLLTGVLAQDPDTFAFLNPFLLVVIVKSGIRFGVRSMYLTWVTTLLAATALLLDDFWRLYFQLTASYILMIALIPVFFVSLIDRIHRVREIEQERARLAAAKRNVAARSSFLAKIGHELRSPLQAIISTLDVFEHRHRGALPDGDELIARIRRSSLLLNAQLRDLLTLARGQVGRLELRPEVFDARELVSALAGVTQELADAKGLKLSVVLPPEPLFLVADAARIDQILTNLVMNSIRHIESGSIAVYLDGYDPAQGCVVFRVEDSGPGLPAAALETLSVPIESSDDLGSRTHGLGLIIVRTLVDHLDGSISVTTPRGSSGGTSSRIAIPAEVADVHAAPSFSRITSAPVLAVIHRDRLRSRFPSLLEEAGITCEVASSAAIAANRLALRNYGLVFVDLALPKKDAAQFVTEVRAALGLNVQTAFVALAGDEYGAGRREGFAATLVDPYDGRSVRSVLEELAPHAPAAARLS